ncbi:MAG: MerR family transcriptional regulator [Candidatus Tectomicrobia bacterium]|nr:MerR family transcriptional regulator [Candidatus Tectomicrobia bacterium]
MPEKMTIGQVAKATGLSPKTIRYYEGRGLLAPRLRTEGGYRQYEEADVKRLLFIRRAKELGMSLGKISDLLRLWPQGTCATSRGALKEALRDQMDEIDSQLEFLRGLRDQLEGELSELDKRPLSDHGQGYCECLGELPTLIPIEVLGNSKGG